MVMYLKFIMIFISVSCLGNRNISENTTIYDLIIEDIKQTEDFKRYANDNKCSNFEVSKFDFNICELTIQFNDKEILEKYEECKNINLEDLKISKDDLSKYSDSGKTCFKVFFSQKINQKIIVNIKTKISKNKFSNQEIYFLYDLSSNDNVQMIESYGLIID